MGSGTSTHAPLHGDSQGAPASAGRLRRSRRRSLYSSGACLSLLSPTSRCGSMNARTASESPVSCVALITSEVLYRRPVGERLPRRNGPALDRSCERRSDLAACKLRRSCPNLAHLHRDCAHPDAAVALTDLLRQYCPFDHTSVMLQR